MPELWLPRSSDFFFRFLFGFKGHESLLKDFINPFLIDAGFSAVKKVVLQNPYNLKTILDEKESILDVRAADEKGRNVIVELQMLSDATFKKRCLYYWAKNYSSLLKKGESYDKLCPVISINIVGFTLFPESDRSHGCFCLLMKENPSVVLSEDQQIYFLELPKLKEKCKLEEFDLIERWGFFFQKRGYLEKKEMQILFNEIPAIEEAEKLYQNFNAEEKYRRLYEAGEKKERDRLMIERVLKEQGRKEGLEQGLSQGLEQGLSQGLEQGRMEMAKKMKLMGFSLEEIEKISGLSRRIIKEI